MPPSSPARLLSESAWPTSDPQRDHDQLGRIVRLLTWLTAAIAVSALVVAAIGDPGPGLVAMAFVLLGFVAWIRWAWPQVPERGGAWFVTRVALVILLIVTLFLVLVPETAFGMTGLALIPVVVGLPYLDSRRMIRLVVIAWFVCIGIAVFAETGATSGLPDWMAAGARVLGVASGAAAVLVLLWQHHHRLSESARELDAVVAMSRDLAQVRDPALIGDRMARHLALAMGADACTILRWDREGDALTTFGLHPPVAGGRPPEIPLLVAAPARRVLASGVARAIDAADPRTDHDDAGWTRGRGHRSLLLIPLSVQGETIGLLELAADRVPFAPGVMERARTLATEAAMALENTRLYEELRHQAFHDTLTGLANRALFTDRLEHALARRQRRPGSVAVLFIDVDDFKAVNDRLGHLRGDELLQVVAGRLTGCLRAGDTAARVGGDEFAVLLEDVNDRGEAGSVAGRIVTAMQEPVTLGSGRIASTVSIGICTSDDAGEDADTLLRDADFAMYRAKAEGKGRVEVFRPSMRAGADERLALGASLQGAAERGELRLQFQPVVDLRSGAIGGVEALVRWESPAHGRRMPSDFIALAEDTGLIVSIGRWVLLEACRQTRAWQRMLGRDDLWVSVNISGRQFQHETLATDVAEALERSGLPPGSLVIELTESVLMVHTPSTIATLQGLRALGVRVAIDDFGTGYSSLSYLQRFPVDVLKIDRTFVEAVSDGPDGAALMRAIVDIGAALHLKVVAEGIERPEQIASLVRFGCGHGQGYLFAEPLDAAAAGQLLISRRPPWSALVGDDGRRSGTARMAAAAATSQGVA